MSGLPLVVDNAQCDLDVVDRERESFDLGSPKALGSSCAFGIMSEFDFNIARGSMIDVDARLHYADWMDFRLGQQTALSWAGVDAFVVPIAAHPFLRWCALCGVAPSEQSLDAFAAIATPPRSSWRRVSTVWSFQATATRPEIRPTAAVSPNRAAPEASVDPSSRCQFAPRISRLGELVRARSAANSRLTPMRDCCAKT